MYKLKEGLYSTVGKNHFHYAQQCFYPMNIPRNSHYTAVSELVTPRRVPFYEQVYLNELQKLQDLDKFTMRRISKPQGITLLRSTGMKVGASVPSLKVKSLRPDIPSETVPGNLKTLREDLRKTKGGPLKRSTIAVNVNQSFNKLVSPKIS